MKKLFPLLFILALIYSSECFSQLSDRVNSPSTFKIGTRPVKGNLGIYFGLAYNEVEYWFDHDIDYTGLPLVSLKYYLSNKVVVRSGFQISQTKESAKGTADATVDPLLRTIRNYVNNEGKFQFSPGVEYHFKSSNLLDVYIGGIIPFGWKNEQFTDDSRYSSGNYDYYTRTLKTTTLGLEGFIGLQAFIADLPLALGFELGLSKMSHLNNNYKNVRQTRVGTVSTSQTYYTTDIDAVSDVKFKTLSVTDSKLQGNLRVTLTFFFNK
jgi:hypothetical protein